MYTKNPVAIYTAGEMTDIDNQNPCTPWRTELEVLFKGIPIKWCHPTSGQGHTAEEPDEIVRADLELIDNSEIVIAYLNRPELYGTTIEIMYAISKYRCVFVVFDSALPLISCRHGENLTGHGASNQDLRHDYWFLENFLNYKNIVVLHGDKISTAARGIAGGLKRRILDYLTENGYPTTEYQAYINSDDWKQKSSALKDEAGGICSLCGKYVGIGGLQTHHKKYPKNFKHDQKINWIAICKICHNKIHGTDSHDVVGDTI